MGGVLITGTDTGVGKTRVATWLARALADEGQRVAVMKPCETGVPSEGLPADSDAARLLAASGCAAGLETVRPYAFPLPVAPSVAAREAGATIDQDLLDRSYERLRRDHDVVLVEGAGGLLVPLAPCLTFADLAARWRLPVVVVARTGLGTLNHTALTVRAARSAGLRVLGVVLNAVDEPVSDSDRHNLSDLERLAAAPVLAELPHGRLPDPGLGQAVGRRLLREARIGC